MINENNTKMHYLIEDSPIGKNVVGQFNSKQEAIEKMHNMIPVGECHCDYYVTTVC